MGKLLEEMILLKLQGHMVRKNGLSENQFGFRKGRSTVDPIQAVVDVATKAKRGTGKHKGFCVLMGIDIRNVFNSKLFYAAPIWTSALNNHAILKRLFSAQRGVVMRIVSAYRTESTSTVLVLGSVLTVDLLVEERKETFQLRKELTCLTNPQVIARTKEAIRKDGRRRLVEKWQTRWYGDQSGRWTHRLILELTTWLDRTHGKVGFYLAQALSGHDCFNACLKRFKKREDESCSYCGSLVDNAEHTLFFCARRGVAREAVGREMGAQLTPDTMVSLILQSEQIWILIESFVTVVIKTRELGGRAELGNNGDQQKSYRGLHPRYCVLGGFGCPRRSREELLYPSPD